MSKVSQLFQQNLTRIWIWICSFWLVLVPFLKGKVRNALHTWRNWPASEFWKCIILCWFITLFPMWVRALFKHLLLDPLPAAPYSSWLWVSFWVLPSLPLTPSPFLESPVRGDWNQPRSRAVSKMCMYLSTCFLVFRVTCGLGPSSRDCAQSPWVLRLENKLKWAEKFRGTLGTLQESGNR